MMENKELMEILIKCVFAVLSVVLTGYVIPWLKAYVGEKNMAMLMEFIQKCVEAAEKLYLPEEWMDKKKYVLKLATEKLAELGLNMSEDELNAIIEGYVKAVKG